MTDVLANWMVLASESLLGVVLFGLTVLSAWVLLLFGGFVREASRRPRQRAAIESGTRFARDGARAAPAVLTALACARSGLPARLAAAASEFGLQDAERALGAVTLRVRNTLATHTLLTRIAPIGGLIATLLPLGPALRGLGEGDVGVLAENLTVAFAATVVGLLVSCASFTMGVVRRSWYRRDLDDLEGVLLAIVPDQAEPR